MRNIPSNFGYVDLLEMVNSRASASGLMQENKGLFVRPTGAAYASFLRMFFFGACPRNIVNHKNDQFATSQRVHFVCSRSQKWSG
jgi:hypothetical protein